MVKIDDLRPGTYRRIQQKGGLKAALLFPASRMKILGRPLFAFGENTQTGFKCMTFFCKRWNIGSLFQAVG